MSKINISFNLKQPNSAKETLILMVVRWNGQRIKTSSTETVHPKNWNKAKQRVKDKRELQDRHAINKNLDNLEAGIKKAYRKLEEKHPEVWKGDLKHEIDVLTGRATTTEAPKDFIKYVEYLISKRTGQINPTTKRTYSEKTFSKYRRLAKLCIELDKNISFNSFDKRFYSERFEKFLINKDFTLNTIGKYTQTLKTILKNAKDDGVISNEDFKEYTVHKVESHNIYLSDSDIKQLFALELSDSPHLERVRDMFVLGTQTGLRFSDLYRIRPHHIEGDVITLKTYKSPTKVEIPVFPLSRVILNKYNGLLPKAISNQKFNEYVKVAAEKAGLNETVFKTLTKGDGEHTTIKLKYEMISSHTMRRSFCTNLYLAGYPILGICAVSGHKTESEFIKYVKVSRKENAKSLLAYMRDQENTVKMYG